MGLKLLLGDMKQVPFYYYLCLSYGISVIQSIMSRYDHNVVGIFEMLFMTSATTR